MRDVDPFEVLREQLPGWNLTFTDLDGTMGYCDTDARTIVINTQLTARQRRSTIVHEIIHALRGDTDDNPEAEAIVARDTARELVPLVALVNALARSSNISDLLDSLDVDHGVLRTRIRNLTDDEASAIRRVLAVRAPADSSELCAIGRWWRRNQQPEPIPCRDCCPAAAAGVTEMVAHTPPAPAWSQPHEQPTSAIGHLPRRAPSRG